MLTIIRFDPVTVPQLRGALLRWQNGLGFGSFVSRGLDLVVTVCESNSRPVLQLLHILDVQKHPYKLRSMPLECL